MPSHDGTTRIPFRGGVLSVNSLPLPAQDSNVQMACSPDAYGGFLMPGLDSMEMCEEELDGLPLGARARALKLQLPVTVC